MTSRPLSRAVLLAALSLLGAAPLAAQNPVGEVFAADATVRGSVVLVGAGTQVLPGSSVTAGKQAATVRLARGGEVRVCPGTSVSVSGSASGRDLMWGMGTGAMETHFALKSSADAVMTPDFRLLLAGPGEFHFAIGADSRGNTCVHALARNTASIIVTELMGDGVYQVRPGEQVNFREGRVAAPEATAPLDCGCPPSPAVEHAAVKPVPPPVATEKPVSVLAATRPPETAPPPELAPGDLHVQVDLPLVFNAVEVAPAPPEVAWDSLPLASVPVLAAAVQVPIFTSPGSAADAPKLEKKKKKGGFFGLFSRLFGKRDKGESEVK